MILPDLFFLISFFIIGAVFGSFSNVVIVRMPQDESLWSPSHCRACQKKIPWFSNVPIFGWIFLKGQCQFCKSRISIRYLLVELIMAFLFALTFHTYALSWYTFEVLIFIFGAVTASFIDIDHMILPDEFTIGGTIVALLGAALNPERLFFDALIGMLLGGGVLLLIGYLYWFTRGREGMGGGDIKLLAWIGALVGYSPLLFILMASCFIGIFHSLYYVFILKKEAHEGFPFGPAIVLATMTFLFLDSHTIVQFIFP